MKVTIEDPHHSKMTTAKSAFAILIPISAAAETLVHDNGSRSLDQKQGRLILLRPHYAIGSLGSVLSHISILFQNSDPVIRLTMIVIWIDRIMYIVKIAAFIVSPLNSLIYMRFIDTNIYHF